MCEGYLEPNGILGDPFARVAQLQLHYSLNYPGDSEREDDTWGPRFQVYRTGDGYHCIMDTYRRDRENVLVESDLLRNPDFDVSRWYAQEIARADNVKPAELEAWLKKELPERMGDARRDTVNMVL
ncbi:hypothetical protein BD779DRAFT_1457829, partial [Infundibulicybe gibba]